MADYPSSLASWSDVVDGVDFPQATHVNQPNNEVIAVETELGTDVAGSATNLKTRLAKSISDAGYLDFVTSTEKTISGGAFTPDQNWHTIDTEADAASDDLDTIVASGVSDGFMLFLRADNTSRTIVVKNGTGNIATTTGSDITLNETYKYCIAIYDSTLTQWILGSLGDSVVTWGSVTGTLSNQTDLWAKLKGRAEILSSSVPLTLGAPMGFIDSASSPVDSFPYFEFGDSALAYVDLYCRLIGYNGGGLTVNFEVLRTSASAAAGYYFQAAIRRINTGTEVITSSHTYDYNSVTVTVPAGPPSAGIPMAGTITFTDGSDMDSLADGEAFVLRFRRDPTNGADNAGDAARVLATITVRET